VVDDDHHESIDGAAHSTRHVVAYAAVLPPHPPTSEKQRYLCIFYCYFFLYLMNFFIYPRNFFGGFCLSFLPSLTC
jgi:hypothetical protein